MDYAGRRLSVLTMWQLCFPAAVAQDNVAGIAEVQRLIWSDIFRVTCFAAELV